MKKVLKVIVILFCLIVFGFMALISSSDETGEDKKISSVNSEKTETSENSDTMETAAETKATQSNTEAVIEECILFDEKDIKITATELKEGMFGPEIKVAIENNSSKSVTIQTRNASVNGYMISPMFSVDVAAGKKANDAITFGWSDLESCGIEQIAVMEFSIHIFDSESWNDIKTTDAITIKTSIADDYKQNYDDSGDILVDTKGIKIIGKGLSGNESVFGPGLILYIENNSKENVTIQTRDVSINGYMAEASISEDVAAGKKAVTAVQFFDSDLEENAIADITDMELSFHIFNAESWNDIFTSEAIRLTFE